MYLGILHAVKYQGKNILLLSEKFHSSGSFKILTRAMSENVYYKNQRIYFFIEICNLQTIDNRINIKKY